MPTKNTIPFDPPRGNEKKVIEFVRAFFEQSREAQKSKHQEFQRVYEMYKLVKDMTSRDKYRSNIYVPILYWIVETIMPAYTDAILGVRPYIPIEANQKRNSAASDAQTQLLDTYLDESDWREEALRWIKYVILYGTAGIEATPDFETKRIIEMVPRIGINIDGQPQLLGMDRVPKMQKLFKLNIRAFAPWQIFGDPTNSRSLEKSRGIIKFRGMVSRRQLKKMIERSPLGFEKVDFDKLDSRMDELSKDDWSKRMAQDIGVSMPANEDDEGVWLSYESEGRYIDLWNFGVVLRDIDNPYSISDGGHGGINLTEVINNIDPNDYQRYGIGEGRPVENLAHAVNENWDQTFDNHNMNQHGVTFYDPDAVSVDQLIMIAGNRIPVNKGPGETFEDVIYERPQRSLPSDHYNLPAILERMVDQTAGLSPGGFSGDSGQKIETAREAILVNRGKDARMKLKIQMGEMGLARFARKVIGHIEQFTTPDDIVAKLGIEVASALPSVNPDQLDGGFTYAMKGSARMADALIKRQDAKDLIQLMKGWTTVNQEWLANFGLERFEVPDAQRRKAVLPDEQAIRIQALIASFGGSQGQGAGAETTRLISNGQQVGGNPGQSITGRDNNEKLSVG